MSKAICSLSDDFVFAGETISSLHQSGLGENLPLLSQAGQPRIESGQESSFRVVQPHSAGVFPTQGVQYLTWIEIDEPDEFDPDSDWDVDVENNVDDESFAETYLNAGRRAVEN